MALRNRCCIAVSSIMVALAAVPVSGQMSGRRGNDWALESRIRKADKSEISDPTPVPTTPKIYWTDPGAGVIQRANLDGSRIETVIHRFRPIAMAADPVELKVYWTDAGSRS